jgi:hypothetical protein
MKALSLTRPWPFAFLNGPEDERKRVENRSWRPPDYAYNRYFCLHAAQSWDEDDRELIMDMTGLPVPGKAQTPHSQIFAVCRLLGYVTTADDAKLQPKQRRWFFGPVGWLVDDVRALPEPVHCKGALSLWTVPAEVEAEVRRQLSLSTAAIAAPVVKTPATPPCEGVG